MKTAEEKLQLLSKMAGQLNPAGISWGVGGSLLLYLKGIVPEFRDIDLMVAEGDAETARSLLGKLGTEQPSEQNTAYRTRFFHQFLLEGVEVDLISGFRIVRGERVYDRPMKLQPGESTQVNGQRIPLDDLGEWRESYRLMGRENKVQLIDSGTTSYVTTASGIHFYPLCPNTEMIRLEDIAHSLALSCRANGHTKHFYSVAQHSLNCALEAEARGWSKRLQLACLLHDGSEAYLSDVTRPVKGRLTEYLRVEEVLQDAIWNKYLGTPLTGEERRMVFQVDDAVLSAEFRELMPETLDESYRQLCSVPDLSCRSWEEITDHFLWLSQALQH